MSEDKFQEQVITKLDEMTKLDEIKDAFIQNERDHGELSSKIESVRGELSSKIESLRTEPSSKIESLRGGLSSKIESLRTEVELLRTEIQKKFNSHLRWSIGTAIGLATLVFVIAKYVVN